jgi:hypothetical protein
MERTETRTLAIAAFAIASSILPTASKAVPGVDVLGIAGAAAPRFICGMFTADGRASNNFALKLVLPR